MTDTQSCRPLRVALVGYGHRGAYLYRLALKTIADLQPAGICDINTASRAYTSGNVFGLRSLKVS